MRNGKQITKNKKQRMLVWAVMGAVLGLGFGCSGKGGSEVGAAGSAGSGKAAVEEQPKEKPAAASAGCSPAKRQVSGRIMKDADWCGEVEVVGDTLVGPEATLQVAPGTRVKFRASRDPLRPDRRITLRVEGQLQARGTAARPIHFTSASKAPVNGDWHTVELVEADGSHMEHALFEYAEHGLTLVRTDAMLRNSVVRFNNWHGVSGNRSKITIAGSRIYANGYNCVDATGGSRLHMTTTYLANCRLLGLHVGRSTAHVEENLFQGHMESIYISGGSDVTLVANAFSAYRGAAVTCGEDLTLRRANNSFSGGRVEHAVDCAGGKVIEAETDNNPPAIFRTGLNEGLATYLDYIPGQVGHDPFPYLLPEKSATRAVDRKIGKGLWMTWAIAWDEPHLWVADLEGKVKRIDSTTGEVLQTIKTTVSKPWGMTHFKGALWINDYNARVIFIVDPKTGKVLRKVPSPDQKDGCRGMTDDGKSVFLLGYATPRIYMLKPDGEVFDHLPAPRVGATPGAKVKRAVKGALAWDGAAFWAPAGRLIRFDRDGKVLGWAHATGAQTMGLAWDGDQLWTVPRLNEAWEDRERFFRVKILKLAKPDKE